MKPNLSPRDLADAVGVSQSSIKRWVDDGRLRASRTAGGHRRISRTEALRFVRQQRMALVRPEILGLPDMAGVTSSLPPLPEVHRMLFRFLKEGAAAEASSLLLALYLAGHAPAEIMDGPVREAMHAIGEIWHDQSDGIFFEHRATTIIIDALNQLRHYAEPDGGGPLLAMGASPSGDPYFVPTLMAATVLAIAGIETTNLGPDTPVPSLREAVARHRPMLTWLSVTNAVEPGRLSVEIDQLAQEVAAWRGIVVVGGQGVSRLSLQSRDDLHLASTMAELGALAHGLLHAGTPSR